MYLFLVKLFQFLAAPVNFHSFSHPFVAQPTGLTPPVSLGEGPWDLDPWEDYLSPQVIWWLVHVGSNLATGLKLPEPTTWYDTWKSISAGASTKIQILDQLPVRGV